MGVFADDGNPFGQFANDSLFGDSFTCGIFEQLLWDFLCTNWDTGIMGDHDRSYPDGNATARLPVDCYYYIFSINAR